MDCPDSCSWSTQLKKLYLQVNDVSSTLLTAQLLFLEAEDSKKPIKLYINSPGGSVTAGLGIYDTVRAKDLCAVLLGVLKRHDALDPDDYNLDAGETPLDETHVISTLV